MVPLFTFVETDKTRFIVLTHSTVGNVKPSLRPSFDHHLLLVLIFDTLVMELPPSLAGGSQAKKTFSSEGIPLKFFGEPGRSCWKRTVTRSSLNIVNRSQSKYRSSIAQAGTMYRLYCLHSPLSEIRSIVTILTARNSKPSCKALVPLEELGKPTSGPNPQLV